RWRQWSTASATAASRAGRSGKDGVRASSRSGYRADDTRPGARRVRAAARPRGAPGVHVGLGRRDLSDGTRLLPPAVAAAGAGGAGATHATRPRHGRYPAADVAAAPPGLRRRRARPALRRAARARAGARRAANLGTLRRATRGP